MKPKISTYAGHYKGNHYAIVLGPKAETNQYNPTGDKDTTYGWLPVPREWIDEVIQEED